MMSEGIIIYSDSRSALEAIQKGNTGITQKIHSLLTQLEILEKNCILQWIPAHVGIEGNEMADELAKEARKLSQGKEQMSIFCLSLVHVVHSELSAIDTALKDININSPSKMIIYSDSRAAIYTLQSCFSSQEPLLKSIAKSVNRLPANSSVTVQWLPAYVGIPGNELADSLAKAGALGLPEARESTTQLDERDLLRTIKTQCLQE
ncbi:hypothetical protein LAZ67_11002979 [Cordylochernes scorpioides]|uniref:ribonuclease H n=1 Tax=Cordylochernes scorpioides TaxID=51811 RepID=A0ABY6L1V7_9ARAC|nr:hypothetical protein LAZ67_11002979 [Cordylochernes scorpioides]